MVNYLWLLAFGYKEKAKGQKTNTIIMSSKGIEPFTALTNSFTENHHYQSDHLPSYLTFP